MATVIRVENLSKAYQLGQFSTGTLSRDLHRWWALTRGKEDPFLKIGETNDRSKKGESDVVWSLKDLNFEIEQGDTVGIIGRNGAGKSTLLKILSQVTTPSTGTVKVKGRVASLLEVGTGFHPELTGKENIFLNGAILGMRKKEIALKFDEIVDFSGVERYIDTPVKRYSSGMYVRLAFAVAAHLESEILIVDEVLAVGDAEFQKKCLGKMGDISKGEGRTILFVSHNMPSIQSLCKKVGLLEKGQITFMGEVNEGIEKYMAHSVVVESMSDLTTSSKLAYGPRSFSRFLSVQLKNNKGLSTGEFVKGESLHIFFEVEILFEVSNVELGFAITKKNGGNLVGYVNHWDGFDLNLTEGKNTISCQIPEILLLPDTYSVTPWIKFKNTGVDCEVENAISFNVVEDNDSSYIGMESYKHLGIHQRSTWSHLN